MIIYMKLRFGNVLAWGTGGGFGYHFCQHVSCAAEEPYYRILIPYPYIILYSIAERIIDSKM